MDWRRTSPDRVVAVFAQPNYWRLRDEGRLAVRVPTLLIAAFSMLVAACGTPAPPTSNRIVAHAATAGASGTLLVVDVCLNYSPVNVDDYFVLENARQGASALATTTARFFESTDIRVHDRLVPFVCGALHDSANAPKRVAERVDGDVSTRSQPLWVSNDVASDGEYVRALQVLATHAFESALNPSAQPGPTPTFSADVVRDAATKVAQKSGRSSLIYIGATGHSLSSGKATAVGVARVVAGIAISVAIGPAFTAGGASYGVVFVPGGPVDKRQMVGALFDLQRGTLVQSKVVHAGGDPMKAETLTNREVLQLLLRDLAFTPAPR